MGRIVESVDYDKYLLNARDKIRENQEICKLLYYNEENPLEMLDIEDTSVLSYDTDTHQKCIYLSPFAPSISEKERSVLGIFMDGTKPSRGQCLEDIWICFNIICHVNLWETQIGIRPNQILKELNKMFGYTKGIDSIGNSLSNGSRLVIYNKDFSGYTVSYKLTDFS